MKQKIYNISQVFWLKYDIILKKSIGKILVNLDQDLDLNVDNNKKYKLKSTKNYLVNMKKAEG